MKELDLADTGVGEEDCAQLALLIENTDHLEVLNIGGNCLSSNTVTSIIKSLLQNSTIRDLKLWNNSLSKRHCKSLALLLQQAECKLMKLNIFACKITGEGAVHLGRALTNNHSLTELDISYNQVRDIGAAAFGDGIRNNTSLTVLNMGWCGITSDGCAQLAAGLTENTALQTLLFGGNSVGLEGAKTLSKVIEENKTLMNLWLDSLEEGMDILMQSYSGLLCGGTACLRQFISNRGLLIISRPHSFLHVFDLV